MIALVNSRVSLVCKLTSLFLFLLVTILLPVFPKPGSEQSRPPEAHRLLEESLKLLHSNDLDRARQKLEEFLKLHPTSAQGHYLLGVTYEGKGDLQAATRAYRTALQQDPKMVRAHDRLGFVLGRLGETQEAIGEFEIATELEPNFFRAQYHLSATLWGTE